MGRIQEALPTSRHTEEPLIPLQAHNPDMHLDIHPNLLLGVRLLHTWLNLFTSLNHSILHNLDNEEGGME
jgi:hypothetical protein